MIDNYIRELVNYGLKKNLINENDVIFTTNRILEVLNYDDYREDVDYVPKNMNLRDILNKILDYAYESGTILYNTTVCRDLLDTKLMGCLTCQPSMLISKFNSIYENSKEEATNFLYQFSQDTDYIRTYRVINDIKWKTETEYGKIDITINLSKPEKNPIDIINAGKAKASEYPKCLLCIQNEGYKGRLNHPARQNLRILPININNEKWAFQYSPYVYYNEHCIVLNTVHTPMTINKTTFKKLFDFINIFPHYFVGSNADLPIVGGSILSHEHFQGGKYQFAIQNANVKYNFRLDKYMDVECGILNWPVSVIRLKSRDTTKLIELGYHILSCWRDYNDEYSNIISSTNNQPHNTITPIARKNGEYYELDLALRNNITTPEYPLGVFHPHENLHHIKKENIGLIEVMGLAVLPSRLKMEMDILANYILEKKDIGSNDEIKKHAIWAEEIINKYDSINNSNIHDILKYEIGIVFKKVLEDVGVYKCNDEGLEAFKRFISIL